MKAKGAAQAAQIQTPMLFEEERLDVGTLSQWYTHPKTADALHRWASLPAGARVLEPSCGEGALVKPRLDLDWMTVDIDRRRSAQLPVEVPFVGADFLDLRVNDLGHFDAAVTNPPYEGQAAVRHVVHALDFAAEVIALVKDDFEGSRVRWDLLWKWVRGPVGKLRFISRPDFGGSNGAMGDYVVYRLRGRAPDEHTWRRARPRGEHDELEVRQVWW